MKKFLFGGVGIFFFFILINWEKFIERAEVLGRQETAINYAIGINEIIQEYFKIFNKPPLSFEELNQVSLKQNPNNETITYVGPACPKNINFEDCFSKDSPNLNKEKYIEPKGTFFTYWTGDYNFELINNKERTFLKIIPTNINELGASSCFNHKTGAYGIYFEPSQIKNSFSLYNQTQRSFIGEYIPLEYC